MNVSRISWGIVILFIGLILLFTNLGFISFNWFAVFSLWPVLLILVGINYLLPEKSEGKYIVIFATVAALALFAYQGIRTTDRSFLWGFDIEGEHVPDADSPNPVVEESFSREMDPAVHFATLHLEGGVLSYEIKGGNDKLFEAQTLSNISDFSLSDTRKDNHAELRFKTRSKKNDQAEKGSSFSAVNIELNTHPVWDIRLDLGVGAADLDLSSHRIKDFTISSGVSSVILKLGMPYEKGSKLNIDGGLASFEIQIPRKAACKVVSKSALTARDFEGFIKQDDGSYITEGYVDSDQQYSVYIESGLSSFTIKRY